MEKPNSFSLRGLKLESCSIADNEALFPQGLEMESDDPDSDLLCDEELTLETNFDDCELDDLFDFDETPPASTIPRSATSPISTLWNWLTPQSNHPKSFNSDTAIKDHGPILWTKAEMNTWLQKLPPDLQDMFLDTIANDTPKESDFYRAACIYRIICEHVVRNNLPKWYDIIIEAITGRTLHEIINGIKKSP